MIQAKIAGHEYNSVDPSKMLSNRMVNEQNSADGEVFEFEYLGNMHMIKLNIKTTEMQKEIYMNCLGIKRIGDRGRGYGKKIIDPVAKFNSSLKFSHHKNGTNGMTVHKRVVKNIYSASRKSNAFVPKIVTDYSL